jgi:hypothetical protein
MPKPAYYIEVDTYWQDSPSFFVGPFASRQEATNWHASAPEGANLWLSSSICGGDIRSAWRVYANALSQTEARKRGLKDDYGHGYNILPAHTEPTAAALSVAKMELYEILG